MIRAWVRTSLVVVSLCCHLLIIGVHLGDGPFLSVLSCDKESIEFACARLIVVRSLCYSSRYGAGNDLLRLELVEIVIEEDELKLARVSFLQSRVTPS